MTRPFSVSFVFACLAIFLTAISPARPEGRPAAKDVEVTHGGDFFRDRTEVPGTIRNASRTHSYPCLNVMFLFQRGSNWEPELMKITGLRPGETRRYTFRTRPSDAVMEQGAFPCADPVAADGGGRCTVVGALIEPPNGFRQIVKESRTDRGTLVTLDTITLRDAKTRDVVGRPARRTLDHRKHLMFYTFSNVPVGRDLVVWLSRGWTFGGRETVRVRCHRGGERVDIGRRRVQVATGG